MTAKPSPENQPNQPKRINIELPADLEVTYANMVLLSHSASEIIMDFTRIMPNTPKSKVCSRIVMTPMNAKLLHRALSENLKKFEAKFGPINIPESVVIDPNRGFTK